MWANSYNANKLSCYLLTTMSDALQALHPAA